MKESNIITIFSSIKDTDQPFHKDVGIVLQRIKEGKTKELVKKIRLEKNKSDRNVLKKKLPAICFSGRFKRRNDDSILEHSGIICLDFDDYPDKRTMLEHKENFTKNKFVLSVFVSPSGNGNKVLVKIPRDIDNHKAYFNALQNFFDSKYFDVTCSNISRVCYESYDPLIYINENSSLWEDMAEPEYKEVNKIIDAPSIPITDENKIVDILVKWWVKKFPMEEGKRNHNVYILAAAFNDYGISKPIAKIILNQYESDSFSALEIERTIDSAYSHTDKFGTKYYEDKEKIDNIKVKLKRGVSKKEIKSQLQDTDIDPGSIDAILNKIEGENSDFSFWTKSDKGVIKMVHVLFKKFLEDNGFYKYCPEGGKSYVFVRVTDNLIDHTSEKEIKDFILGYVYEIDDQSIYNFFADSVRYFREEFLTLLATIDIYFVEDSRTSSYLYYRNCAVKITKDSVETIDYIDLGGYVWKDHVIDRKFTVTNFEQCDYMTFIKNICNKDESRVKTMESTIGFMMHGYKNLSYCPAVILNDEVISDNPEGGTGKGVFMNALSQVKKLVVIDGKQFAFESSFPYQTVSADTQILVFDDVKKHFNFERLFSVVTEGMTLEKKNKDAIKIPFSKSPKISITTNYAIKGSGNSFARRKWEVELHQHYNKNYTPLDEFGKHFFADWDDDEWRHFDNYMVFCLMGFLDTGLVKSEFVNLKIRLLSAATNYDFIEWCGLTEDSQSQTNKKLSCNSRLISKGLYDDFVEEYPDYSSRGNMTTSRTKFYRWVVSYALYKTGIQPEVGRDVNGKFIIIKDRLYDGFVD
tara:strand:- start:2154 stop:4571 length:2418 start_codon:yes stop_codon:yes gene_type:complete